MSRKSPSPTTPPNHRIQASERTCGALIVSKLLEKMPGVQEVATTLCVIVGIVAIVTIMYAQYDLAEKDFMAKAIRRNTAKGILDNLKNGTQISLEDVEYLEATIAYWEISYIVADSRYQDCVFQCKEFR